MAREEDEVQDAVDPGEPPVMSAPEEESEEEANEGFPDAQIIVDEQTGQTFIAFEIDPSSIPEEGNGEEGGEEK